MLGIWPVKVNRFMLALSKEVVTVPPSRLLTLLGQALKWQQQQGAVHAEMGFDLFRNTAPVAQVEMDTVPERRYACIKVCI